MKVLLAVDGSTHSSTVVEQVASRLFPQNTELCIVAAYEKTPPITAIETMGMPQEYYAEADNKALKLAEGAAENAATILRKKNPALTIKVSVIEGYPKSVILEEAETFGADLIIVGSHGYGAVERFLMGSVSQAVALHAKCSVEIVRFPDIPPIKREKE